MGIFTENFKCETFLNEAWDSWSVNGSAHFINFFYYLFFQFKINILRNVKNGGYDIIVFLYCKVCINKGKYVCSIIRSGHGFLNQNFKIEQLKKYQELKCFILLHVRVNFYKPIYTAICQTNRNGSLKTNYFSLDQTRRSRFFLIFIIL